MQRFLIISDDFLYFFNPIRETKKGYKGVGMIRAEIGLKNRQIINETNSFRCFLIL